MSSAGGLVRLQSADDDAIASSHLHKYRKAILDACALPPWCAARVPARIAAGPSRDMFTHAALLVAPQVVRRREPKSWQILAQEEKRERQREQQRGESRTRAERILGKKAEVAPISLPPGLLDSGRDSAILQAQFNGLKVAPVDAPVESDDVLPRAHFHGLTDVRFRELTAPQQHANVYPYTARDSCTPSTLSSPSSSTSAFLAAQTERLRSLVKHEVIHVYRKKVESPVKAGTANGDDESKVEVTFEDASIEIDRLPEPLGNGNREAESLLAGIRATLGGTNGRGRQPRRRFERRQEERRESRGAEETTVSAVVPATVVAPIYNPFSPLHGSMNPAMLPRKRSEKAAASTNAVDSKQPIIRPPPQHRSHLSDTPEALLSSIVANNGVYVPPKERASQRKEDGTKLIHLPATMEPQIMKLKGIQPGTTERQIRWCFEGVQVDVRRVRMQAGNEGIALVEYWPLGAPARRVKRTVYERLYRIQGGEASSDLRALQEHTRKAGAGEAPRFYGLETSTSYVDRRAKLLAKVAVDMNVHERYYTLMSSTPGLNAITHRVDKDRLREKEKEAATQAASAAVGEHGVGGLRNDELASAAPSQALSSSPSAFSSPRSSTVTFSSPKQQSSSETALRDASIRTQRALTAVDSFTGINISQDLAALFAREREQELQEEENRRKREAEERQEDQAKSLTMTLAEKSKKRRSKRSSLLMDAGSVDEDAAAAAAAADSKAAARKRRSSVGSVLNAAGFALAQHAKRGSVGPPVAAAGLTIAVDAATTSSVASGKSSVRSPTSVTSLGASSVGSNALSTLSIPRKFSGLDRLDSHGMVSPRRASAYSKSMKDASASERKTKAELKSQAGVERQEAERKAEERRMKGKAGGDAEGAQSDGSDIEPEYHSSSSSSGRGSRSHSDAEPADDDQPSSSPYSQMATPDSIRGSPSAASYPAEPAEHPHSNLTTPESIKASETKSGTSASPEPVLDSPPADDDPLLLPSPKPVPRALLTAEDENADLSEDAEDTTADVDFRRRNRAAEKAADAVRLAREQGATPRTLSINSPHTPTSSKRRFRVPQPSITLTGMSSPVHSNINSPNPDHHNAVGSTPPRLRLHRSDSSRSVASPHFSPRPQHPNVKKVGDFRERFQSLHSKGTSPWDSPNSSQPMTPISATPGKRPLRAAEEQRTMRRR